MRLLGRILRASLVGLLLATGAVAADEPNGAEAARDVIQSQLDAFQAEAVAKAYEFAAPNIRRIFPNPDVFGRMVRDGYPMVWDPSEIDFLDARPRGEAIVQRLRIVDQAGVPYIAEYAMLMIDGEWRIAGVEIKKDDSFGA